jgi:hypothetical protein
MPTSDQAAWVVRVLKVQPPGEGAPGGPEGLAAFRAAWRKALSTSRREAASMTDAIIARIGKDYPTIINADQLRTERLPQLEAELDYVGEIVFGALDDAGRASGPAVHDTLRAAVTQASSAISTSALLSTVDRNGVLATAIITRLNAQLGALAAIAKG